MTNARDKFIEPDRSNPELEAYREAGKGYVADVDEVLPQETVTDDSTHNAQQASVPDSVISEPVSYERGTITDRQEIRTEDIPGDFSNINKEETEAELETRTKIEEAADTVNDKSYLPGSGAVRNKEDRLPKGTVDKDSIAPGAGVI